MMQKLTCEQLLLVFQNVVGLKVLSSPLFFGGCVFVFNMDLKCTVQATHLKCIILQTSM